MLQVLEILDYLHSMTPPEIHRDIKPQNLMRTSKGQIFLVDFGAVQDVYRNTLDSEKFRLWWNFFNLQDYNLLQGDTADIKKVELSARVINGQTMTDLVLWLAKDMHKFASSLTPIEKEWLAAEISDFWSRRR